MQPSHVSFAFAFALCVGGAAAPVAAQPVDCANLYRRVVALYQTASQSPEYAQTLAAYKASCAGGPAAAAAPPTASASPASAPPASQPFSSPTPLPNDRYAPGSPFGPQTGVGIGYGVGVGGGVARP